MRRSADKVKACLDEMAKYAENIQEIFNEFNEDARDSIETLCLTRLFHIGIQMLNGNLTEEQYDEAIQDYVDGVYRVEEDDEDDTI